MVTDDYFLSPICEKTLICLEDKSMTPRQGNTILFRSSHSFKGPQLASLGRAKFLGNSRRYDFSKKIRPKPYAPKLGVH